MKLTHEKNRHLSGVGVRQLKVWLTAQELADPTSRKATTRVSSIRAVSVVCLEIRSHRAVFTSCRWISSVPNTTRNRPTSTLTVDSCKRRPPATSADPYRANRPMDVMSCMIYLAPRLAHFSLFVNGLSEILGSQATHHTFLDFLNRFNPLRNPLAVVRCIAVQRSIHHVESRNHWRPVGR